MKRVATTILLSLLLILNAAAVPAQSDTLAQRVQAIMDRPEFKHALFGIEFYSLDKGKVIYAINADKLFTPGSTTKLLTEGTALSLLGSDYRFHTSVYRTGRIDEVGALEGDLVLVASGDPNLSGRIRDDGTLAFENEDHSYDGDPNTRAVQGDLRTRAHPGGAQGLRTMERGTGGWIAARDPEKRSSSDHPLVAGGEPT